MSEPILNSKAVQNIIMDLFFRDGEEGQHKDAILVRGVVRNFGFHPGRVAEHKEEIKKLLAELPIDFFPPSESFNGVEGGGGMSFLQGCMDRHGNHWAEHQSMEALFCMGMAIGHVGYLLPREIWPALPGGMPYITIDLTNEVADEIKVQHGVDHPSAAVE